MLSRRQLLSGLLQRARQSHEVVLGDGSGAPSPPPPAPRVFPVHRPPGAVAEADFLARCTRCGECLQACPHQAIVLAPARLRTVAGTPVIDAVVAPCRMCDDTPCAQVCEPYVLSFEAPLTMGTARLERLDCLAWQGAECSDCVEHCPVPGALTLEDGRPEVHRQTCTGCGVCLHVCPAPRKAFMILPVATRPAWQEPVDEP